LFFEDAFRDALVGNRPSYLGRGTAAVQPAGVTPLGADLSERTVHAWVRIISRESLEDEVKSIAIELGKLITTPSSFRDGAHQIARREFSMLAVLMAVIGEYDGEVRWQRDAPQARDLFARAAANAKAGSLAAFQQAQQRLADLQQLVRGDRLAADQTSARTTDWGTIVDRLPLMDRLRIAEEEGLATGTESLSELRARGDRLRHEAELMALIAEVLTRGGMPDAEDADYTALSRQLQQAALAIVEGVKREDLESARRAIGEVNQSCNACHERYRG
jgi:hypothetical protein